MSGEFDSRKDSQSTKFERRPRIFVKLSFRELYDSKLSGLHAFHKIYLHHQVLYKTNNVTEFTNATKLRIKN